MIKKEPKKIDKDLLPFFKKLLEINLYMTILFYIVFLFAAIFEVMMNSSRWIVIIIAVIHPLVAIPLAFFTFYKGY